jgi:hypothetical protein
MDDATKATLYVGRVRLPRSSFAAACKALWLQGSNIRDKARIEVADRTYDADDLERLRLSAYQALSAEG